MSEYPIPIERRPWLMNDPDGPGYEMPEDSQRCEARYLGKYRCAHWKDTPHKYHWAAGGNLEWDNAAIAAQKEGV